MTELVAAHATDERGRKAAVRMALVLVVVAAALGAAFLLGTKNGVSVHTGTASSAEGAISIEADGWTYSVPLDGVEWVDSLNAWHDSGRPECLPPTGATHPIRFGAVDVTAEQLSWRSVVWVDCR